MTVKKLAEKLNCKIEAGKDSLEREISGCYICDLLSYVISKAGSGSAWITIMTNVNTVAVAMLADVACIIVAEGNRPDSETIAKANEEDIAVLSSDLTAYELAVGISKLI